MSLKIIYPVPLETPEVTADFMPFIKRWCDTFVANPPGIEYEVYAVCMGRDPTEDVKRMFEGINARFVTQPDGRSDGGAIQFMARKIKRGFYIGCTSRVYFHRRGWGEKMVCAMLEHGPGYYSAFASSESRPHLCFRFHGMQAEHFLQSMPDTIEKREDGWWTEIGNDEKGNLTEWFEKQELPARVVTWQGSFDRSDWFRQTNGFRHGDQSECLVFDRHTDIFHFASDEDKTRLHDLTYGPPPSG